MCQTLQTSSHVPASKPAEYVIRGGRPDMTQDSVSTSNAYAIRSSIVSV